MHTWIFCALENIRDSSNMIWVPVRDKNLLYTGFIVRQYLFEMCHIFTWTSTSCVNQNPATGNTVWKIIIWINRFIFNNYSRTTHWYETLDSQWGVQHCIGEIYLAANKHEWNNKKSQIAIFVISVVWGKCWMCILLSCNAFAYKPFMFLNMVLRQTEYSNTVNVRHTFQPLVSFWLIIIHTHPTLINITKTFNALKLV